MKSVNNFIKFLILLLSALCAHEASGGTFIGTHQLLWQSAVTASAIFAIRNITLEGPSLAMAILFLQSTSHFILGGGSSNSAWLMGVAHLISGIISYFAITYSDCAWAYLLFIARYLLPQKQFTSSISIPSAVQPEFKEKPSLKNWRSIPSLNLRGPPVRCAI
jgi:hypothetical protein